MPELKYQKEIDEFSPCFIGYNCPLQKLAFRWVSPDKMDCSFYPVFKLDPKRRRDEADGWALSFFETKQQAHDRLQQLLNNRPELHKRLGTHIAKGVLDHEDGLCENIAAPSGHFNHFEYVDIKLWLKFTVVEKVV